MNNTMLSSIDMKVVENEKDKLDNHSESIRQHVDCKVTLVHAVNSNLTKSMEIVSSNLNTASQS